MTADQRFSLIIAGLGLVFVVMSAILGLVYRAIIRWTKLESKVSDLIEDKTEDQKLVREELNLIREQMKEDRNATNERLTWLERNAWGGKDDKSS